MCVARTKPDCSRRTTRRARDPAHILYLLSPPNTPLTPRGPPVVIVVVPYTVLCFFFFSNSADIFFILFCILWSRRRRVHDKWHLLFPPCYYRVQIGRVRRAIKTLPFGDAAATGPVRRPTARPPPPHSYAQQPFLGLRHRLSHGRRNRKPYPPDAPTRTPAGVLLRAQHFGDFVPP